MSQNYAGKFDAAGQAFTKELGAHSVRLQCYSPPELQFLHQLGGPKRHWGPFLRLRSGCNITTASGRQCYADRFANFARKYGSKIQYYEVWNEWNGGFGLGRWPACLPTCADGVMYTDLLCRTYRAVKAVRPSAKVVGGATARIDMSFITKMLNAGAGNCMDALSVHPYVWGAPTWNYYVPIDSPASVGVNKFIEAITAAENLVQQKTGKIIPIAVTEDNRRDNKTSASQRLSAAYITELYRRAPSIPFLEGIWLFCSGR